VSNVNAERKVASALSGPVDWNEALREGWVRGVVVDFDNVDLSLARGRLDSKGKDLGIGRCAIEAEGTEGGCMTLEGLTDVPSLGKELHVAPNATGRVRGDSHQARPALIVIGDIVDDLVVLYKELDEISSMSKFAYLELFLAVEDLARRNSVLGVEHIPMIYSLCADKCECRLADPPPELNVFLVAVCL